MQDLTPTYADEELADMLGVEAEYWYLIDDNHKVAAGPFPSRSAAEIIAIKA
jgi:hypothetical protein